MSARARVPGPLRRLVRQPLRLGAIGLLALTAVSASGIQSAAALALRASLDENWRGVYDILVAAPGGVRPLDGLLPSNTLASGDERLSLDDLAAVRAVAGVGVAAPIGEVVTPSGQAGSARVAIPFGFVEGARTAPQAFRVQATYSTDDGLGERIVEQREFAVVVDEAPRGDAPPKDCSTGGSMITGRHGDYEVDPKKYPLLGATGCIIGVTGPEVGVWGDGMWGVSLDQEGALSFQLPSAPQPLTRVTLVDPVAEQQLLGEAGGFLDPLVATASSRVQTANELLEWADAATGPYAQRLRDRLGPTQGGTMDPEQLEQVRQLFRDNGDDFDAMVAEGVNQAQYAPLLISDEPVGELSLKLDVFAAGEAERDADPYAHAWTLPDGIFADAPGRLVGSTVGDVSPLLSPFTPHAEELVWPGARLAAGEESDETRAVQLSEIGNVSADAISGSGGEYRQDAAGYAAPVSGWRAPGEGIALSGVATDIGAEAAYANPERGWIQSDEMPLLAVPVGGFSPSAVGAGEDVANYVPLGAYTTPGSMIASGANAGATLRPAVSGLGLVSPHTGAIGSIYSASLWKDDHPISAIRVRVADVDAYTAANRAKIVEVAAAIQALGYDVTIVAGSSPTDTDVQIAGYAFGTADPDAAQRVGDLGAVTQRWSELGAAARVSLSVSTATLVILGIALASGILLLGAVQLAGIPGRRDQAVVMREVGFTRPRIARWFAIEELPGLVVVGAVALIAWRISDGTGITAVAGLVAAGTVLVTGILAVVAGSSARRVRRAGRVRDARSRRLGARTVAAFGARQVLVHPLTTAVHIVAIVIVGLSGAGLAAALLTAKEQSGASSLALQTLTQQLAPQLALGGAGIVAGILLARLTRRLDLARRADQWATLRAAGWTGRELATAQRVEGLTLVVPALALTAAVAALGVDRLALPSVWIYVAVAVVAGAVTALAAFSTRKKGTVA